MLLVLVAILVAFNAGAASLEADAQPAKVRRAALSVASVPPLTVAGQGFRAGERVRVSAKSNRKSVRASPRGRFVVRFAAIDPCNSFSVLAVGDRGSRASLAYSPTWRLHCARP